MPCYGESVIDEDEIQVREGLAYNMNAETPFTGKVVDTFHTGQLQLQFAYKDGLKHGASTTWYTNGRIRTKCNYKNGVKDGMWIKFNQEGQAQMQKLYKDGKRVRGR